MDSEGLPYFIITTVTQKKYYNHNTPKEECVLLSVVYTPACVVRSTMWPLGTFPDKRIASWIDTFSRYRQLYDRPRANSLLAFVHLYFVFFRGYMHRHYLEMFFISVIIYC
jgi:hypothetical protein